MDHDKALPVDHRTSSVIGPPPIGTDRRGDAADSGENWPHSSKFMVKMTNNNDKLSVNIHFRPVSVT